MNNTILILGGDGYLGWPLSMKIALDYPDQKVLIIDNQWRRETVQDMGFEPMLLIPDLSERVATFRIHYNTINLHWCLLDVCSPELDSLIASERPHTIYHMAQQCSAPYSMTGVNEAIHTLRNNEESNMRLLWAVRRHVPRAHIVKLGSFGEYAKGGIPIAEGHFQPIYKGVTALRDIPYPRSANDVYHVSKINDSNYVGMATRMWGLAITEVMQSTVFGILTAEMDHNPQLYTRFDYDPVFGTVANRFVTQAVSGIPLTIYGDGYQRTGLMALCDAVKSLARLVTEPAKPGEHRILNHVTETHYTINELAHDISKIALNEGITSSTIHLPDMRKENSDTAFDYEVESSLQGESGFHTDFLSIIGETIMVLKTCRKPLSMDNFTPTISWADTDFLDCRLRIENNESIANESYWTAIRKEYYDSSYLNLNPGCVGTQTAFNNKKFNALNSWGNPLGLYENSRDAFKRIRQECELLWPSEGYLLTVTYSTSQFTNLLALTMLRKLREYRNGPICVLTSQHEHPGGISPFERLPEYRVIYTPDEIISNQNDFVEYLKAFQPDIVFLSHTYYDTGLVTVDEHTLRLIKKTLPDTWLILDVAQSIGIHSIPMGAADVITGSTHKWLFGPYGAGLTWIKQSFTEWLGALFWNDLQLFPERTINGFSIPGGHDFHVYAALQRSLELYRRIGPEAIHNRSRLLCNSLQNSLSAILYQAGVNHQFINTSFSPCLILTFEDYDPYNLYRYLHEKKIHIKCLHNKKLNNLDTVNILRIGVPYYESQNRLSRFLHAVEAFFKSSVTDVSDLSLTIAERL